VGPAIQLNEITNDVRTTAKPLLPKAIREDYRSGLIGFAFVLVEETSNLGMNSQNPKEARRRWDDR
jgi:hypothetical protein